METRRLGRSGLEIHPLVLGTLNFGSPTSREEAFRIVDAALEAGLNLIDCADVYAGGESERILGAALAREGKRDRVLVSSKAGLPSGPGPNQRGSTRYHIITSCEQSLKRLRTDRIDIYFLHRTDMRVPQEESLAALDQLRRQGKILYAACSTHPPWRTVEALMLAERHGYPRFVCEQAPYNLLDRRAENEIVPMCLAFDLGLLCWSPLAQGQLAGRYSEAGNFPKGSRAAMKAVYGERVTDAGIRAAREAAAHFAGRPFSPAQLAVAWLLSRPGVTGVLLGPRTQAQLTELLGAAEAELSEEDLRFCDGLVPPGRFVSDHFNTSGWMK
jgi:aryl-alcohol dehydrogenase-like predicted oxidoreductase